MATLLHGESRRMYSWWWDSHICPKNSKWLQDNLTDMDRNVKTMIKLIEEDADSFARRAEMFYKKRPELMKLVEEFYRAYRALAERYDHATGELRQAHSTMAKSFPYQILQIISDESPSSSGAEFGPHTPEIPSPMHAPLDLDDLQKDVSGLSNFHARRKNGAYSEEGNLLSSKEGLKQLKEMFTSGERLSCAKPEGKVRKVLNFKEDEGNTEEKEDHKNEIECLHGEVSQLTMRKENLMALMASELQHARTLDETVFKLEALKEAALLQYKLSIERMSSLETDICNTRHGVNKVNDEMVVKLNSIEEQCLAMEKVNKSLQLELENQQKELEKRGRDLKELNTSIEVEHQKRMQAEVALVSMEQIHTHYQEEVELLILEIQSGSEKLKKMELNKVHLEEKISELNKIIGNLREQNISFDLKIKDLQVEMKLLKETKEELEHELGEYMKERKALKDELLCLKEDRRDLEQRNRGLTEQVEVVTEKNIVLKKSLSDANIELEGLQEKANALESSCVTLRGEVTSHVVEKDVLISQIEIIFHNMEKLSEKSTYLENSLSDANAELEGLRTRLKELEECCMSLRDQNSTHLAEKNALVSQVENLENKYLELQNQHLSLEEEKNSKLEQVMELQCSLTLEKQEHEALLLTSSSQLDSLHSQIIHLEEQLRVKMEDFESEQEKKLLEASTCMENQNSQLKHKELMQKNELTSLSKPNGVLTKGIHLLLEALSIDLKQRTDGDMTEEVIVQIILAEIKNLLNSLSDTRDENHQLHLQASNIEAKHLSLGKQLANLEEEKDSAVNQVLDLDRSLRLEKEEHEAVILSLSSQLASLQNQVHLLQEEIRVRDEELELGQQSTIKAQLQNFVLQGCLSEMKDSNLFVSGECQNLIDAVRCAEKQISKLKHKDLIQNEELTLSLNRTNILRSRINLLLEGLYPNVKKETMNDLTDEAVLETISDGIRNLLSSISDACDENQCFHLELLVLVTHFKQIGLDNFQVHHEIESRIKELLALANEKHKLMVISKQLEDENNFLFSQVIDTSDARESKKSSHRPSKEDSTSAKAGFLDLQKLIAKFEALQKVIIDSTNLVQQEKLDSNAKLDAPRKEIEELKLKEVLLQEKSKEKHGQNTKDIQLDQVSSSRIGSYSTNNIENAESDDQMLELWETAGTDEMEAVEEVKSENPSSKLVAEKEMSIDKLGISARVNKSSPPVWKKGFIEKLDSDAQRLSSLQRSLQELKSKLESSEKKKYPKTSEYGTLKAKLREAEEAILEQIDIHGELKKVNDNFESSSAAIWEKERRQVSEQARRGSETIGKLELELQKIEYIFLKFEEDENMRSGRVDRKSSTPRDYISGKRDGKVKRRGLFCGCMRPKTKALH